MVLPLTLTLSRKEREPSGRRFRAQHIAGWRLRLTRPTTPNHHWIRGR